MGWVTKHAPTRAELSACVECGLCLPHCPTFRLTGKETASPRGRLMAMSAVAAGVAEIDETFADIMSFCLQCRACEAVCPSLVPFGRAMEGTRVEIAAQLPSRVRRVRHLLLGRVLTWRTGIRVAGRIGRMVGTSAARVLLPETLRSGTAGLRDSAGSKALERGRVYEAYGQRVGRLALLAGCVMDSWFGEVHIATVEVLRHAGYDVAVPSSQTCCGALAAHDGDAADTVRLARANAVAFSGYDGVVANAAGCSAHLKEYGHWAGSVGAEMASRTYEITEVVVRAFDDGLLPELAPGQTRVAVQDPCHNRHAQRIHDEPRRLLRAAGCEPIEIDPVGLCCGAAGAYSVQYPEVSAELGRRKAAEVAAAATTIVASANPGCEMQLRSHLGESYRVAHPIELYWEALQVHLSNKGDHRLG